MATTITGDADTHRAQETIKEIHKDAGSKFAGSIVQVRAMLAAEDQVKATGRLEQAVLRLAVAVERATLKPKVDLAKVDLTLAPKVE